MWSFKLFLLDMKYSIVTLLLILSANSYAIKSRKIVPSVGSPFPAAYSHSDSQSRVLSELTETYSHLLINNTQPVQIACVVNTSTNGLAPTVTDYWDKEIVIPATQGYVQDGLVVGPNIYCRSDSGSARTSSEPIIIQVW